jgi:hypothetical protein
MIDDCLMGWLKFCFTFCVSVRSLPITLKYDFNVPTEHAQLYSVEFVL